MIQITRLIRTKAMIHKLLSHNEALKKVIFITTRNTKNALAYNKIGIEKMRKNLFFSVFCSYILRIFSINSSLFLSAGSK